VSEKSDLDIARMAKECYDEFRAKRPEDAEEFIVKLKKRFPDSKLLDRLEELLENDDEPSVQFRTMQSILQMRGIAEGEGSHPVTFVFPEGTRMETTPFTPDPEQKEDVVH
jgi:hypothetical protein